MSFKGKKAVVVGAAEKSIGQAVAKGLAREGAQVCIWDINTESAGVTAKEIADAGGKAKVMKVNALEYDSVKSAVAETIKEFGGIDYMVDTVGGGIFKGFISMSTLQSSSSSSWTLMALPCSIAPIISCRISRRKTKARCSSSYRQREEWRGLPVMVQAKPLWKV